VLELNKNGSATVKIGDYHAQLGLPDIAWTKAKAASEILKVGDIALFQIRSMNTAEKKVEAALEQKPKVQASLLAIQPQTGEIKAMVGGYDFDESKFNRTTHRCGRPAPLSSPLCMPRPWTMDCGRTTHRGCSRQFRRLHTRQL
jgi:penicillin-binding protein 1A